MFDPDFIIPMLILGIAAVVFAGPVIALVALARGNRIRRDLERLERESAALLQREAEQRKSSDLLAESVRRIQAHLSAPGGEPFAAGPLAPAEEAPEAAPPDRASREEGPSPIPEPASPRADVPAPPPSERPAVHPSVPPPIPTQLGTDAAQELQGVLDRIQSAGASPPPQKPKPAKPHMSLEFQLGTKWINWVGAVILLIGVALGLKYAYDNSWIGPKGRLAIGTSWGVIALILGERFRRKNWGVLFQTLTGLGLGIFYACVYFSFQVYKLSDPTTSFALASGVTVLAIALAVAHNAMPIAIIAVLGGFLSPVLISTGENRPVALFSYVALLDLVALGAAYYRRWRPLELLCFAGTALLYGAWFGKYYMPAPAGQMTVALGFISLFYLMFLLIPTLHVMVRGLPESREGMVLVVLNAAFALTVYYRILYPEHAKMLGLWRLASRCSCSCSSSPGFAALGSDTHTGSSLLILALALVTAAIPLELKLYGIPIAWALEGALLTYVGLRFRSLWTRLIGLAAIALAAGGLFHRLPMHTQVFMPLFNIPFGSWGVVSAAAFVAAWFAVRGTEKLQPFEGGLAVLHFAIGFIIAAFAITAEVSQYWSINHLSRRATRFTREARSSCCGASSRWCRWRRSTGLGGCAANGGGCRRCAMSLRPACLSPVGPYQARLAGAPFNGAFLPRLVFPLALWWGYAQEGNVPHFPLGPVMEVACHVCHGAADRRADAVGLILQGGGQQHGERPDLGSVGAAGGGTGGAGPRHAQPHAPRSRLCALRAHRRRRYSSSTQPRSSMCTASCPS